MPKENVERAIVHTALARRTTVNIKHIITSGGGSLGAQGSVMWAFDKKYSEN